MILPPLYAITDRALAGGLPHAEIVRCLVDGGVGLIQLREKRLPDRALLAEATAAAGVAHASGALLVLNDRPDIAVLAGADGAHVGGDDLPAQDARGLLGASRLLGVSTHSVDEAVSAGSLPVDYVALGPIFETAHAAVARPAMGLEAVSRAAAGLRVPLVAIGGITLERAVEVIAAGAAAVAVMGDLMAAPDMAARASAYRDRLTLR
ncbi:MAG: thiamine phosphate synthase [Candidatus Polarisedimenticolia bacterium]